MRFYDGYLGHDFTDPKLNLNKRGHRCKDIEDLRLHNYFLFLGDNVALDFNSPIENTYPYLISKTLNVDYYNLSIFNGGMDALKYNLLLWFKNVKSKPKVIVVSFEFLNSIITCSSAFDSFSIADYSDNKIKEIMSTGETCGFMSSRRILCQNILLNFLSIPTYQIEFKDKTPLFVNQNKINNIKHDGEIFDHKTISTLFLEKFNLNKQILAP